MDKIKTYLVGLPIKIKVGGAFLAGVVISAIIVKANIESCL